MIYSISIVIFGGKHSEKSFKMTVSHKKLWHTLVDINMKKKDLEKIADITHYQMYKLANE